MAQQEAGVFNPDERPVGVRRLDKEGVLHALAACTKEQNLPNHFC